MSSLPELSGRAGPSSRQLQRAARTASRGQMEVFNHQVASWVKVEKDATDSHAVTEVLRASLDAELGLLDYGLARANGQPAAVSLVGRKVAIAASINEARISRAFRS